MWLLKVFWAFLPTEKVPEQRVYETCNSRGSLLYVFQGAASFPQKGAGTSDLVTIWWATTSVLRAHFNLQQPWSKEREGRCSYHESKPALHTIWYETPIDCWVKNNTSSSCTNSFICWVSPSFGCSALAFLAWGEGDHWRLWQSKEIFQEKISGHMPSKKAAVSLHQECPPVRSAGPAASARACLYSVGYDSFSRSLWCSHLENPPLPQESPLHTAPVGCSVAAELQKGCSGCSAWG